MPSLRCRFVRTDDFSASPHSRPTQADITTYIERLCAANPTLLAFATSNLEQHGPAILVGPGSTFPEGEAFSRAWGAGEIAHLHGQDASLHVSLSPLDAAEVIEKGWGERFPLAGAVSRVPVGCASRSRRPSFVCRCWLRARH